MVVEFYGQEVRIGFNLLEENNNDFFVGTSFSHQKLAQILETKFSKS